MSPEQSIKDGVRFEVAYFELVAARPTVTLLRLGGRWSGVEAAELGPPTLVLEADGEEHRLPALPEAQTAQDGEAPAWRAAFAAPAGAATARSATYRLDAGPVVPLPRPVERRLSDEAAAETGPARPLPVRRVGPRLVAVVVLVVLALLIIVAAATSGGDDEPSGDGDARAPVMLMDVLPMGAGASGEIVADGDGRLVLRLRGLDGRRSGIWLFDSVIDARLVGTVEGPSGQVVLPAVADLRDFRYIDVSREDDDNANHSGLSVLRIATADVR